MPWRRFNGHTRRSQWNDDPLTSSQSQPTLLGQHQIILIAKYMVYWCQLIISSLTQRIMTNRGSSVSWVYLVMPVSLQTRELELPALMTDREMPRILKTLYTSINSSDPRIHRYMTLGKYQKKLNCLGI